MSPVDAVNVEPAVLGLARQAAELAESLRSTARSVRSATAEDWRGRTADTESTRSQELAAGLLSSASGLDDLAGALATHARAAADGFAEIVATMQRAAEVAEAGIDAGRELVSRTLPGGGPGE